MSSEIISRLIDVCHRLYARGMVTAMDGNVSVRLPSGNILTTRSGVNKGMVTANDFVELSPDGKQLYNKGKPSTEVGMHLYIYRQRPDVHAVVHAHPTYATGFATARIALDGCVFPEVIVGMGAIPLAEYATPSTTEVAESLSPYIQNSDAILLTNHGAVTYGASLYDAYFKMEKVEHAAHISFVAHMLGGAHALNREELAKLRSVSVQSYGKDLSKKIACQVSEAKEVDGNTDLSESTIRQYILQSLQKRGLA